MSHNTFNSMFKYVLPSLQALWLHEAIAPVIQSDTLDQVAQKFISSLKPEMVKSLNGRLERGLELAKNGAVLACPEPAHPRCFQVLATNGNTSYKVDLDARICECEDSLNGITCKHRIAAYYTEQASQLQPIHPSPVETPLKAVPSSGSSSSLSVEQILKELGYDPEPKKVHESAPVPTVQLGTLYRHFLHGSELGQQAYQVTITDITKEKVTPHPSQPTIEKWCLWVSGLPTSYATGILFGTRGEEDLMAIFGNVDIHSLKGKQIVIYSKSLNVGGQAKQSIRFRWIL